MKGDEAKTTDHRRSLPVGACTWCGHLHVGRCRSTIQVAIVRKKPVLEPCPCRLHLHGAAA